MAMLGTTLMSGMLSHSDAEKMFRPWWDNIRGYCVYGLIMLGLIVSPTAIFNSTPLFCTLCTQPGQCGDYPPALEDPGYHIYYVRTYCTHKAIGKFTVYFPYVILVAALVLLSIEKLMHKIFKYKEQVEGFHSLLGKQKDQEKQGAVAIGDDGGSDDVHVVEVWQSFKYNSSIYKAYLLRTLAEFVFSLMLFLWLVVVGVRQILNWNTWNVDDISVDEIVDLREDKVRVFCEVHNVHYECAGVPTQFYLYILVVAVILMAVYLLTTIFTLMYLLCPCGGELASFMRSYKSQLRSAAKMEGGDTSSKQLLGELHEIYYENRDLRLLLDLLAKSSGLAPPLRVMALLDQQFQKQCKPVIMNVERSPDVIDGESSIEIEFRESDMVKKIFGKMDELNCLYTVQISPKTDHDSFEIFVFEKEESHHRIFSGIKVFSYNDEKPVEENPSKFFVFEGADVDVTYTVKVTLVLNGRTIASSQKTVKSVSKKSEDEELGIKEYL